MFFIYRIGFAEGKAYGKESEKPFSLFFSQAIFFIFPSNVLKNLRNETVIGENDCLLVLFTDTKYVFNISDKKKWKINYLFLCRKLY